MQNTAYPRYNIKRWLIAIVVLGSLIRLGAAYIQPAYIDEAYNAYLCRSDVDGMIGCLRYDCHTPALHILHYPLAHYSRDIFILRLPEVLCGIIALPLCYMLSRRFLSVPTSLAITAIISVSYQHWMNDAMFRPYGPLTTALLAIWLSLLNIDAHGSPYSTPPPETPNNTTVQETPRNTVITTWWEWPLFYVFCLFAGSLHLLGVLALLAAVPYSFGLQQKRWRTLLALALAMVPTAVWFIWIRVPLSSENIIPASLSKDSGSFFTTSAFITNWELRDITRIIPDSNLNSLLDPIFTVITITISLLLWIIWGRGWFNLHRIENRAASLLGLSIIIPLTVLLLAHVWGYSQEFLARYALPMTVPFLILLFKALKSVKQWAAILIIPSIAFTAAFPFMPTLWNAYWDDTFDFIEKNKTDQSIIAVYIPYMIYAFAHAYNPDNIDFIFQGERLPELEQRPTPGKLPVIPVYHDMLNDGTKRHLGSRPIILVLNQASDPDGHTVVNWFDTNYTVKSDYHHASLRDWGELTVFALEPK